MTCDLTPLAGGFPAEAGGVFVVIAIVAGLAIALRVLAGSLDESRIADYLRARGGRVVSIHWAPFGKGWFGEKNDRIYEVVYYDSTGQQHFATCKTSFFSGVYWTDDRVTHGKPHWLDGAPRDNRPGQSIMSGIQFVDRGDLAAENERLKAENDQLRRKLEQND